jgi:putative transcriptional regulator
MIQLHFKQLFADKGQGKGGHFYSCGSRKDWNFRVTLSKIANSKGDYNTTTDHIEKLCVYFGCTTNDLMTIIPEEREEKKEGKKKTLQKCGLLMPSQPLNELYLIFSLLGFLIGLFGTKKSP